MEKCIVDLDIGNAKLRADPVEGANESGLPSRVVRAAVVADDGIDRRNVLLEAVGHAPNGVGEDAGGADVLPEILSVDGMRRRRRRGNAAGEGARSEASEWESR